MGAFGQCVRSGLLAITAAGLGVGCMDADDASLLRANAAGGTITVEAVANDNATIGIHPKNGGAAMTVPVKRGKGRLSMTQVPSLPSEEGTLVQVGVISLSEIELTMTDGSTCKVTSINTSTGTVCAPAAQPAAQAAQPAQVATTPQPQQQSVAPQSPAQPPREEPTVSSFRAVTTLGGFDPARSGGGQTEVYIFIEGAAADLAKVESVTYDLDSTYKQPFVVASATGGFRQKFYTWSNAGWTTRTTTVKLKSGVSLSIGGAAVAPWIRPTVN